MDRGDTAFGQSFIVFTEATIEAKPGGAARHQPTTGQYGETFLLLRAEDGLKAKAKTLTNPHSERVMQPASGAIVPPLPEVVVNTLPRRKTARQHPPMDATRGQAENGSNHQTHFQAARSPARFGCGNQMLNNKPLADSQICWVSSCFHTNYVYHNLADSLYFSKCL